MVITAGFYRQHYHQQPMPANMCTVLYEPMALVCERRNNKLCIGRWWRGKLTRWRHSSLADLLAGSCTTEYHRGRSLPGRYAINHRLALRRSPGNGCEVEMDRRLTCPAGRRRPWERSAEPHLILNRRRCAGDCVQPPAKKVRPPAPGRTGTYVYIYGGTNWH